MRALVCAVALLFAVGLVAAPAGAQTVFEFTGDVNSGWNVNGNWDNPGYPQAGDSAIIPADKTVCVGNADSPENSACADIDVQADQSGSGTIELYEVYSLTITDDSTINGDILFKSCGIEFCPWFIIGDPVTVTGIGKIRGGFDHGGLSPGNIGSETAGDTLTIPSGFTIQGSITIQAKLTNNGVVLVNHVNDQLWLTTTEPKTGGSGAKWKVTAGQLRVQCQVTGVAKWILKGVRSTSLIRIEDHDDTDTDDLTGDVNLEGGTFWIEKTFCTTGDITATAGNNEPKIIVKENTTATLNTSSCQ